MSYTADGDHGLPVAFGGQFATACSACSKGGAARPRPALAGRGARWLEVFGIRRAPAPDGGRRRRAAHPNGPGASGLAPAISRWNRPRPAGWPRRVLGRTRGLNGRWFPRLPRCPLVDGSGAGESGCIDRPRLLRLAPGLGRTAASSNCQSARRRDMAFRALVPARAARAEQVDLRDQAACPAAWRRRAGGQLAAAPAEIFAAARARRRRRAADGAAQRRGGGADPADGPGPVLLTHVFCSGSTTICCAARRRRGHIGEQRRAGGAAAPAPRGLSPLETAAGGHGGALLRLCRQFETAPGALTDQIYWWRTTTRSARYQWTGKRSRSPTPEFEETYSTGTAV